MKVSIVNYYNTLPFRWALRNSPLLKQMDLQEDIPSICAQKLKFKQVDLALVPVAILPELESFYIVSDFCIGAVGAVDSVKLYASVPLHEISSIILDYQSRSSVTLTRVLAKEFWKIDPSYKAALPGFEETIKGTEAAVIIGDRTFEQNGQHAYEWDLSEEWQKYTGLPFVFAAWVSHRHDIPKVFLESFNAVLKYGVEHIQDAVSGMPPTPIKNLNPIEYLTQRISYPLTEQKRQGLDLFLKKIKQLPSLS